jgi:hypothetical protein
MKTRFFGIYLLNYSFFFLELVSLTYFGWNLLYFLRLPCEAFLLNQILPLRTFYSTTDFLLANTTFIIEL